MSDIPATNLGSYPTGDVFNTEDLAASFTHIVNGEPRDFSASTFTVCVSDASNRPILEGVAESIESGVVTIRIRHEQFAGRTGRWRYEIREFLDEQEFVVNHGELLVKSGVPCQQ